MLTTMDICAPADQTEGTRSQVLRWLKAVGDEVTEHEPLIEIETDKVTVEVAAPASGVLREIVKAEQEEIEPGDVLGRLETQGRSVEAPEPESVGADAGATVANAHRTDVPKSSRGAPASGGATSLTPGTAPRLSPAVRRLLAERNLDASAITGTGEGGRITIDDVLVCPPLTPRVDTATPRHAADAPAPAPSMARVPGLASDSASQTSRTRSIPHTPIRKRIADHMVQSLLHTAPHVTTVFEANLSAVLEHRARNAEAFRQRGAPLTLTAYFLSAVVQAIRAVPEANSRWTDSALEIHEDINIGIATALEGVGLVVPVLRNVESLDLFEIARGLQRLVTAAREGTLEPSDVRGGTFTVSNHGVSGSLLATPIIINQPQAAILGVGKLEKRPVVVEHDDMEQIVARPMCYVTLTIDHRVMDGHQANHFLQTFVRTLESWPAH